MEEIVDITDTRFESLRVPIDCQVDLRLEDLDTSTPVRATNISMSGMFLRTREPLANGYKCSFDFELLHDQPRIRGQAEVIWNRTADQEARGIGVRFSNLDLESKYTISRLVERYLQVVGTPVQLSQVDNKVWARLTSRSTDEAAASLPAHETSSPPERSPVRPIGGSMPFLLTVGFGLGLLTGSLSSLLLLESSTRATTEMNGLTPRAFEQFATKTPEMLPEMTPESAALAPEDFAAAIASTVDTWARAWAAKDIESYLDHYSPSFTPPDGASRADWETQRRQRLARPGIIDIEIFDVAIELRLPDRAVVQFGQRFSSSNYQDQVIKTLELVKDDQGWKILREEALST
ncbi:MAG: PilZ domain-containing protein [Acidobacteriota bacterium]